MSEEFSFSSWLSEGANGIRESLRLPEGGIMPPEFREHMQAARKERLLAWRSLFDAAVAKLESPTGTSTKSSRSSKIKSE